jgi:serine/threonine protein kinase
VVFYTLLSDTYPFAGTTLLQLMTAICRGDAAYEQENPIWESVAQTSKAVIQQMLTKDPTQRPTATELLAVIEDTF